MAGSVTTTTAAEHIPEKWAAKVLMAAESNLVIANLVDRYDADVKQSGDIVHVAKIADIDAAAKTQGSAVSFTNNTEGTATITVDQYAAGGVRLEAIVEAQSQTNLLDKYTKKIGYGLAKAVDTTLAGLATGFSQEVDAGTGVTIAEVVSGIQTLDLADAPMDDRHFVVDPRTMGQLRQIAEFTRYDATGAPGVPAGGNNGLVGNIYNIPVYMSTNVDVTSGTPNVVNNMLFHREALGLAMQKSPTIESERNVEYLSTDVVGWVLYGAAELRDTFGVRFEFDYS